MMWEPNVVAAQVEPYVTDYGIDTVSADTPRFPPINLSPSTKPSGAELMGIRVCYPC